MTISREGSSKKCSVLDYFGIGCPGHRLDDAPGVSGMVGTPFFD